MNRTGLLLLLLSLLVAAGCGDSESGPVAAPAEAADVNATTETTDFVTRAAEIARAVEADPDAADAILERFGVTLEEYEQMMYDIADDPELTRAYEAALGR